MKSFLLENIEFLLSLIIAPLITWFFSKRHFQDRELNSKDIEIIRQNISLYQYMIDDLDRRAKDTISELEEKNKKLRLKIQELEEYIELNK